VIVSVLVLLQAIGLAYLEWYMYQVPTWTATLDALPVARITNSLDKGNIPSIGSMGEDDLARLSNINALVGVVYNENRDEGLDRVADSGATKEVELGLGAPGLFHRRLTKLRMQRSAEMDGINCQCEGCRRRRAVVENDSAISSVR
jgi:hypothetical protein